jgi:hypothetical protein
MLGLLQRKILNEKYTSHKIVKMAVLSEEFYRGVLEELQSMGAPVTPDEGTPLTIIGVEVFPSYVLRGEECRFYGVNMYERVITAPEPERQQTHPIKAFLKKVFGL